MIGVQIVLNCFQGLSADGEKSPPTGKELRYASNSNALDFVTRRLIG